MKELETCTSLAGHWFVAGINRCRRININDTGVCLYSKKDPVSSSVYSMFVVGISSMAGSIQSIFNKLVDFKAVLTFGIPSVIGVFIAKKNYISGYSR